MEPDDVVIADIAGQALDIFLHGPESAHKNGILKTVTHTSIPIHPYTFLKQEAKPSAHQTRRLRLVVLLLSNVLVVDGQEAWKMFLRTDPRRRTDPSRRPSPRTVPTQTICRFGQHILQHFPDNNGLSNNLYNNLFLDWLQQFPRLTPGDSDTWSLMMSLSRTLQVRP